LSGVLAIRPESFVISLTLKFIAYSRDGTIWVLQQHRRLARTEDSEAHRRHSEDHISSIERLVWITVIFRRWRYATETYILTSSKYDGTTLFETFWAQVQIVRLTITNGRTDRTVGLFTYDNWQRGSPEKETGHVYSYGTTPTVIPN